MSECRPRTSERLVRMESQLNDTRTHHVDGRRSCYEFQDKKVDRLQAEVFCREKDVYGRLSNAKALDFRSLQGNPRQRRQFTFLGGFHKARPAHQHLKYTIINAVNKNCLDSLSEDQLQELHYRKKMESVAEWIRECQNYRQCRDERGKEETFAYPIWMKTAGEMRKKRIRRRASKERAAESNAEKRR